MDFDALDSLKTTMQDNLYVEYVFHKLLDNPDWTWDQAKQYAPAWQYPECWRARFWLYYMQHRHYIENARILDLGSNMNFYGVWALLHGAHTVTGIEPDSVRYNLGVEYAELREVSHRLTNYNLNLDNYRVSDDPRRYDVVFLLDIIYYLVNSIDVLAWIRDIVRPRHLFLESSVAEDISPEGHFSLWYPDTDSRKIQSYDLAPNNLALKPSRQALFNIIKTQGWKIVSYYDYQDFKGHGESPPRRQGMKDFYLLELPH